MLFYNIIIHFNLKLNAIHGYSIRVQKQLFKYLTEYLLIRDLILPLALLVLRYKCNVFNLISSVTSHFISHVKP